MGTSMGDLPSGLIKRGRREQHRAIGGIVHCLVCWREIIIWLVVNSG